MAAPGFYNEQDQNIYDNVSKFMPQSKYLRSAPTFTAPTTEEEEITETFGIPNTNAFTNSGDNNYTGGNFNLNDINAVRHLGVLPDGFYVNRRFTDINAWFIKTDVPNGTKMFNRTPLQTKMEPDFDTGNLRFKARERYSFGISDWRSWFGNQGA